LGVEIVISGKLRGRRAKYEKFRTGYLPKSGEPTLEYMNKAELHVQLKPGILGVRVSIMPPDAKFPDRVEIVPPEKMEIEAEPPAEGGAEEAGETPEETVPQEAEKTGEEATK
jgi:small subunit ribosomal protein S3